MPAAFDTEASNCTPGEGRLIGSDDGDEGRLEVCVNGAWGTVCGDEFDSSDAAVACATVKGFSGSGKRTLTLNTKLELALRNLLNNKPNFKISGMDRLLFMSTFLYKSVVYKSLA